MNAQKIEGYIYPKDFFEKNKGVVTDGLCFVMMPFGNPMDRIYEDVISKTLGECGLTSVRADEVFDTKPIMISIMQKINEAELIIAEVTGRNANVFYELGMAHVLKDKVILLTQTKDDVPFDLQHLRYILYENSQEGDRRYPRASPWHFINQASLDLNAHFTNVSTRANPLSFLSAIHTCLKRIQEFSFTHG